MALATSRVWGMIGLGAFQGSETMATAPGKRDPRGRMTTAFATAVLLLVLFPVVAALWLIFPPFDTGSSKVDRLNRQVDALVERVRSFPVANGPLVVEGIEEVRLKSIGIEVYQGKMRHAFNGVLSVTVEPKRLKVVLATMPQQLCVLLLTSEPRNGLVDVRSNSQGKEGGWPFARADAETNCRAVYDTVTMTYLR